jgi:alpha-1,6-mannosyltransferase
VVFRAEIALLLATSGLYLVLIPRVSPTRLIFPFMVSFIIALGISIPIDSYFWQKPLWPELWGFYFNAILGSSSEWGVSPWYYYFTSALPRLLLNPLSFLILIPISLSQPATARSALQLVVPSLLFTAIYSIQPHKEARFIFYVVPPLTAAAAQGANYIFSRRNKSLLFALASLILVLSIIASFLASTAMLLLSSLNYPGGEAMAFLRETAQLQHGSSPNAVVSVHADVLTCMTGLTLFGAAASSKLPSFYPPSPNADGAEKGDIGLIGRRGEHIEGMALSVDKTEDPAMLRDPSFWTRFDYVLAEETPPSGAWEVVAVVHGYSGVEILRPGQAAAGTADPEGSGRIFGRGAIVRRIRDQIRRITGGWWVGPKMEPRIRVLRRVKGGEKTGEGVKA